MESGLDRSPLALVHTHCIMGSSSHALFTFKDLPSYSELIKLGVQCYATLPFSFCETLVLCYVNLLHTLIYYVTL